MAASQGLRSLLPAVATLILLRSGAASSETAPSQEELLLARLGLLSKPGSSDGGSYVRFIRPAADNGSANIVWVQAVMNSLAGVDSTAQEMTLQVWLIIRWLDNRLAWRDRFNSSFDGIGSLLVPGELLWQPDVSFLDCLSIQRVSDDRILLNVTSSGEVLRSQEFMIRFKCRIDVRQFPYDTQRCSAKIASMVQSAATASVRMTPAGEADFFISSVSNEFCVQRVYSEEGSDSDFPFVSLVVVFSRRSTFYLVNIILPSLLLLVICTLAFCLPPECGERVSLSVTIVLSMCVFLQLAGNYTPTQSESVPLLTCHCSAVAVLTMTSLIGNVFVLSCHYKQHRGQARVNSRLVRFLFLNRFVTGGCGQAETPGTAAKNASCCSEWSAVAATVDRCLFALFTVSAIVISVIIINYEAKEVRTCRNEH